MESWFTVKTDREVQQIWYIDEWYIRVQRTIAVSCKCYFDFQDFPFIYQITYDAINLRQTAHVIFHLSCYNLDLAKAIVSMLLSAAQKLPVEQCQPFFKLITFLIDVAENGIPGLPSFMGIILPKLWKVFIFVIAEIVPVNTHNIQ